MAGLSTEERQALRERRWRETDERDRQEQAHREAERARRGDPQRFTLTGMQVHHHEWQEDGRTVRDSSWSLPEIDPRPEKDEVIRVVEEPALDQALRALDRIYRNALLIFDKKPVRDWDETLGEVKSVLNRYGKLDR
jgi:hypothetical protein